MLPPHAPKVSDDPFVAALAIARSCHEPQTDKLDVAYINHVLRVVERVAALAPPDLVEQAKVAAALHDTIEDCDCVELDDLRTLGFSEDIVEAVASVTKLEGEDYPDAVRRAASHPIGLWVKLADNLDNSDPERAAQLPDDKRLKFAARYEEARRILTEQIEASFDELDEDERARRDGVLAIVKQIHAA